MHSTCDAGSDETNTSLPTTLTSPDDASTLDGIRTSQSLTTKFIETTSTENFTTTSEVYNSTLGKNARLC